MSEYKYKLTLEVEDCGKRTFAASVEADSQDRLSQAIAFDIARALEATLMSPPTCMGIAAAMEYCTFSIIEGLSIAYKHWDAETDFSKCVSIEVDMDKLMSTYEGKEIADAKRMLERCGLVCKQSSRITEDQT